MKKKDVRLPVHVKPLRYKIILRPNFDDFTFYGEETVSLSLDKPVKEITLHANELEVGDARIVQGKKEMAGKISHDSKNEHVKFTFPKKITGKGELRLNFKGFLNDKMHGFYRSRYTHNGEEKFLATTQFESTDARKAFPCVDEPAAKAIFDVTLMVPSHMTAISNTLPSVVSEHEQGYKIVQFEPTPKMSTYLLAFIVGEFDWVEAKSKEGVLVRVFTTPGKKEQAKFALGVASKMLSFYNSYFDIPYPLPVLDLIAIPDFAAGAMENWGAVTYRESALLIDPEHSAASNRQRVAIVIAHELAHQWFGNLVTMEWWTHLWLNEGFASYIEYLATDHVFPQWDIWTQFLYSDHGVALKLDGLKNTHPIEVEVGHPSEIDEIFDKVSYSKGASIIRMLANYLGEKDFRDGLRHYLKKHSYANAKTEDLWEAFEHVSGKQVRKIMAYWTTKPGYPLLRLTEGKRSLNVSQSRFFSSTNSKKSSKDKNLWSIPLRTLEGGEKLKNLLMTKRSLKLGRPKDNGWIKLNAEEASFIRVYYPEKFLRLLEEPIKEQKLSPIDRLGIIRDVFDLAESGDTPTHQALELALSYVNEADFTVWMELTAHLSQIESLVAKEKFESMFNLFGHMVYKTVAKKLGWKKKKAEKHTDTLLRSIALYKLGSFGDNEVIKEAKLRFVQRDQKKIDPDLRLMVYKLAAQNGGQKEFNIFKKMHKIESLQQEKDRITTAMSSFKQPQILKQTLEFALSDEVRLQDAIFIITEVVNNPKGRDLAWRFIKRHWKVINERYGSLKFMMPRLIDSLDGFISQADARNIEAFFKKNPVPAAKRTIQQTLEQIYSNSSWLARDRKGVRKFLENLAS